MRRKRMGSADADDGVSYTYLDPVRIKDYENKGRGFPFTSYQKNVDCICIAGRDVRHV